MIDTATLNQVHMEQVAQCGKKFHHAAEVIGCDVMRRIASLLLDRDKLYNYYRRPGYTASLNQPKPEIEIKLPLFLGYDLLNSIDNSIQLTLQSELERALDEVAETVRLQIGKRTYSGEDRSDKLTIVLKGELI